MWFRPPRYGREELTMRKAVRVLGVDPVMEALPACAVMKLQYLPGSATSVHLSVFVVLYG